MDILANMQRFLDVYIENIKRPGADSFLSWLDDSDFFRAPASTRFHGAFPGGLCWHSLNVYDCLRAELELEGLTDKYSPESVALVALLHDVCKANTYKKGYRNVKDDNGNWTRVDSYEYDERFPIGHSEKSIIILQNHMKLTEDEVYAIRAHMGGFDSTVKGGDRFVGKILENCPLALLLHIADFKATNLIESGVGR